LPIARNTRAGHIAVTTTFAVSCVEIDSVRRGETIPRYPVENDIPNEKCISKRAKNRNLLAAVWEDAVFDFSVDVDMKMMQVRKQLYHTFLILSITYNIFIYCPKYATIDLYIIVILYVQAQIIILYL
jgi:hypothetical protein